MYLISWSYDVAYLQSYSVGRDSVVVSLICPTCTITVGVSLLYFSCCVSVYHWCICTGIASDFIYSYFDAIMRDAMPCFPVTTPARLISNS